MFLICMLASNYYVSTVGTYVPLYTAIAWQGRRGLKELPTINVLTRATLSPESLATLNVTYCFTSLSTSL